MDKTYKIGNILHGFIKALCLVMSGQCIGIFVSAAEC